MSVQLRDRQNRPSAQGLKNLPSGWSIKPLGEVVTRIVGGGTPSRNNPDYWKGNIPWLTVKDMRTTRPTDAIDHISRAAVAESSTNIIPANTVIIATRVGLGKVIRVPYEAAINQDLKALIVPPTIEKAYLEYWFLSIASYLESIGSGTTVKGIRLEQLKGLELPIPPIRDQRRIVAEIEKQFTRLDAGIAALRRTQANLKRYRVAVLKAACEGRLVPTEAELARKEALFGGSIPTGDFDSLSRGSNPPSKRGSIPRKAREAGSSPVGRPMSGFRDAQAAGSNHSVPTIADTLGVGGSTPSASAGFETGEQLLARILIERRQNWQRRGQYKEPAVPDKTKLGPLPAGWTWATVEQLADIGSGNTPPRIAEHIQSAGPIPWFKVGDMNRQGNEQVMRSSEGYLTQTSAEALGLKIFPAGSIIFPKRGGAIATNKKRQLEAPAATDLNVMALTPHREVSEYFERWFAAIDLASLSDGSNVPQVNNKDIQPLPIPLPPLAEQIRIVAEVERRLSVVEELEAVVTANLQRAARLRQSILQTAFTGELK